MTTVYMLVIGVATGILSGLFGIGGGLIIVPALVWLGFTQHAASGTSLVALLLPVGLLGVLEYYQSGKIGMDNIKFGLLIAVGLFVGAFFGSKISIAMSGNLLRKSFAVLMGFMAIRLWLLEK
jgi:uncharacterized protein